MRKLVVIALLLGLAGFAFAAFHDPDTVSGTDTLTIHIRVHMIGLQWSADSGGYFSDMALVNAFEDVDAEDSVFIELGDATHKVLPCDTFVCWLDIENTGAVTLDYMVSTATSAPAPAAFKGANDLTCASVSDSAIGLLYFADAGNVTPPGAFGTTDVLDDGMAEVEAVGGAAPAYVYTVDPPDDADANGINLIAESSTTADEDEATLWVKYVAPSTLSFDIDTAVPNTLNHRIWVRAKVSD